MQKETKRANIDRNATHKEDIPKTGRGAYKRRVEEKQKQKAFVPDMSCCTGCVHLRSTGAVDKNCFYIVDVGKSRFPISFYHEMDRHRGQENYREVYDAKVNEMTRNCPHKKLIEDCSPKEIQDIKNRNGKGIHILHL